MLMLLLPCAGVPEERLHTIRATSAMEAAKWKEDMEYYSA
jgi:hypothetical protein